MRRTRPQVRAQQFENRLRPGRVHRIHLPEALSHDPPCMRIRRARPIRAQVEHEVGLTRIALRSTFATDFLTYRSSSCRNSSRIGRRHEDRAGQGHGDIRSRGGARCVARPRQLGQDSRWVGPPFQQRFDVIDVCYQDRPGLEDISGSAHVVHLRASLNRRACCMMSTRKK